MSDRRARCADHQIQVADGGRGLGEIGQPRREVGDVGPVEQRQVADWSPTRRLNQLTPGIGQGLQQAQIDLSPVDHPD